MNSFIQQAFIECTLWSRFWIKAREKIENLAHSSYSVNLCSDTGKHRMPRKHMGLPIPHFLEEMKHQKAAAFQIVITIHVAPRSSGTINHHTTREAFRATTIELSTVSAPNTFCFIFLTCSSLARSLQRDSRKYSVYKTRIRCYESETIRKPLEMEEGTVSKKYKD